MVLYPATGEITGAAVAEREATFVLGIRDHLPPGALGLMLIGMLAALASTVDTHLNWGAGYWTNDLYDRLYCQRIRGHKADPSPPRVDRPPLQRRDTRDRPRHHVAARLDPGGVDHEPALWRRDGDPSAPAVVLASAERLG